MGNASNAGAGTATVLEGNYLSKAEAAAALGKELKTIEAMGQDGRLKTARVPRPKVKPEVVYLEEDVKRLKRENEEREARRQDKRVAVATAPKTIALTLPPELVQMIGGLAELARQNPKQLPAPKKRWMTLEEAVEYSGLGVTYLKDSLVFEAQFYDPGVNILAVKGGKQGAWVIRRDTLEAFQG